MSLVNVIRLQRSSSSQCNLKDEEPKETRALGKQTVEIKSGNNFYLPKRKLVHKPVEPFKLFIDEKQALAKLVWLYLLEVKFLKTFTLQDLYVACLIVLENRQK